LRVYELNVDRAGIYLIRYE